MAECGQEFSLEPSELSRQRHIFDEESGPGATRKRSPAAPSIQPPRNLHLHQNFRNEIDDEAAIGESPWRMLKISLGVWRRRSVLRREAEEVADVG